MEVLETVMRWVIIPLGTIVWLMFQRQQDHTTQIAILKTESEMSRLGHDREIKEIRAMLQRILEKLDDKMDKS